MSTPPVNTELEDVAVPEISDDDALELALYLESEFETVDLGDAALLEELTKEDAKETLIF
jgi:hypothetical protein